MNKTMHCECGNVTYNIKFNGDGDLWAVCADCGRPTMAIGIGEQKQRQWRSDSRPKEGENEN